MDPTKLLEADHRKAEDLFEKIRESEGEERMALVRELETELQAHMEIEEKVLYPAMVRVTGEELVEEGTNEHDVARTALREVMDLAPEEPGFPAALDALEAAIDHHVEDEEEEVFPKLRNGGQRVLEELEAPFLAKRRDLGLPLDAEVLSLGFTRDELLETARELDIDGTSQMDKDDLAGAVAGRLAG